METPLIPESYIAIAEEAYKAYGRRVDNKNYAGLPMPLWEQLPLRIQQAWTDATKEVARLVIAGKVER